MRRSFSANGDRGMINYTVRLAMSWYYLTGFTRLNRGINIKGNTVYQIPYNSSYVSFEYESPRLKPEDITLSDYSSWDWFHAPPEETPVANWTLNTYYTVNITGAYMSTYIPRTTVAINGDRIDITLDATETQQGLSSQISGITTDPSGKEFGPFNASGSGGDQVIIRSFTGRSFTAAITDMNSYTIGLYFNDGNKTKFKLYR
ncbi:MAG: hypothetical protein LIP06_10775 [Tannerellaceae bacterium]|nr:hypothetical protein [Tannerellaceae bacterium]